MTHKKGQIWVETVLYTLIGLALIGITLAIISPKISQTKDKLVVEQSINSLNVIDEKINEVLGRGPGNVRIISDFTIKRGEFYINSTGDSIVYVIKDLNKPYSEPGIPINIGRIKVLSEEGKKSSTVYLTLYYIDTANITYHGEKDVKKFSAASTPYKFLIENVGDVNNTGLFIINIDEVSGR
ncbi:MAG: hypothetical protein Q7S74_01370 [Nanoarchaeota archaeon]|nr:hypothetical protein [Nanoarchaeota archaeon]